MAQTKLRLTNGEIHGGLLRNRIRGDSKSFSRFFDILMPFPCWAVVGETPEAKYYSPYSICFIAARDEGTVMRYLCAYSSQTKQADEMRPLLNKVRTANSAEDLQIYWESFKAKHPRATTLINYIEKNWINETSLLRWVSFAREVRFDILMYP